MQVSREALEQAELSLGAPIRKRLRATTAARAGASVRTAERSAVRTTEHSTERTAERTTGRTAGQTTEPTAGDVTLQMLLQEIRELRTAGRAAERTTEPTEEVAALQTLLQEVRELRNERAQFRREGAAEEQQNTGQSFPFLSQNNPGASGSSLGYKLKPDTFDGEVPLREFLGQFNLIARANQWGNSAKAIALASCLRGKARAVLDGFAEIDNLQFEELEYRLKLRFGEEHGQSFYCQFTNRKQKVGEDFPTLGADLERMSRLAYPECSFEVRDKIACSQFIAGLSDGFLKRTLQLEGVASLQRAVERALAIKAIQENSFPQKNRNFGNSPFNNQKKEGENKNFGKNKGKDNFKAKNGRGEKECWQCGKTGHFRSECPSLSSEEKGNSG